MSRIACCNRCADSNGADMPACDCCGGSISPEDASEGKRVPTVYRSDRKPIRNYRNFSSHPCQNGGSCKCGGTCKGDGYSNWITSGSILPGLNNIGGRLKTCQDEATAQGMVLGEPTTVQFVQQCLTRNRRGNSKKGGWLGLWNKGPLSGPGSNLNRKLKQCQADAQASGMVLGQPDTVKWVTDCLQGKHPHIKIDPTVIDDPIIPTPTTTTTTITTSPTVKTAGFMGLPNLIWIGVAGLAIYYGNKKGMFKKILK